MTDLNFANRMENSKVVLAIRNARNAEDALNWLGNAVIGLCNPREIDSDRAMEMLCYYRTVYKQVWERR